MRPVTARTLRIVQLSDPQLGFSDSQTRHHLAVERGVDEHTLPLPYTATDAEHLAQAVAQVKVLAPHPDGVLVAGDMVDAWDNPAQWEDYTRIMQTLELPVYETMGNHDGFSAAGLDHYRNTLGKRDYYHFTLVGVFFLVLNSNYLKHPDTLPEQAQAHHRFVEQALLDNRNAKHKLILMHHPLYFEQPDEEEGYFTLALAQRQWVLGLAERYDVRAVLSGHYHRNSVITYNAIDLITSGPVSAAMGSDNDGSAAQTGFRVLDLDLETGELGHHFIPLEEHTNSV